MNEADVRRELDKIARVLTDAYNHHSMRDRSNAALHMSDQVIQTPLTVALERALHDTIELSKRIKEHGVR